MSDRDPLEFLGVINLLDAGLIVLDQGRKVTLWNDWIAGASGITTDQALTRSLPELFSATHSSRLLSAIEGALTLGTSSILTHTLHKAVFPLKTPSGRDMVHDVTVRPLLDKPVRCMIQIADVTVSAERDRVLRDRQNARYEAVVHGAPDSIITMNHEGAIESVNPAAARQFGYSAKELIGMKAADLFEASSSWSAVLQSALRDDVGRRPVELEGRRTDGSSTFLEISASPWKSQSRVFVTAILRDVNERRAVDSELRNLNQTLEQRVAERTADRDRMWRLSSDVMVVIKADGDIAAVNPAWKASFGWSELQLIGKKLVNFVAPDDRAKVVKILDGLAQEGRPLLFEIRMLTKASDVRTIAWSAIASEGLVQAVGRDVTVQRDAETALRKAEGALRQSQKMEAIGQLTGGIAHDFNNLLTGIIGAVEAIRRRIAANRLDDLTRFMDAAINSSQRAAALTHRLLAFSRLQSLDPQAVDINALVEDMIDLLRRTIGEQIRLDVKLDDELWPAIIDANQLENAVLNLAINSRDAMPNGGTLTIATTRTHFDQDFEDAKGIIRQGDYVVISVSDTGSGMAPEVVAKVFEPFFTTKPIGQGTGLGLSMVYGFVEQSNGHLRLESDVGKGTTISLYFPRSSGVTKEKAETNSEDLPLGSGETVLLVEDDASVRLLIADLLRDLGYTCIEANEGLRALAVLKSDVPLDLMISDVGLPGMNGRELADAARVGRPDLKVLFVTGYAPNAINRSGFLAPGMELITKPFNIDELATKIRKMIE
jgi:PAS domain S-box-containing protein